MLQHSVAVAANGNLLLTLMTRKCDALVDAAGAVDLAAFPAVALD